jgi:hypothetical protein
MKKYRTPPKVKEQVYIRGRQRTMRTRRAAKHAPPPPLLPPSSERQPPLPAQRLDSISQVDPTVLNALVQEQRNIIDRKGIIDLSEIVTNGLTRARFSFLIVQKRLTR